MAAKKETETQTNHREKADGFQEAVCFFGEEETSSAPRGNGKGQQKKKESVFGFPFAQEVNPCGDAGPLCDPLYQQFRSNSAAS